MSTAGDPKAKPHVVVDCRGILQLLSDGTVVRSAVPLVRFSFPDVPSVEHKDAVYDETHGLALRLYRPSGLLAGGDAKNSKLPVVVFFHGGGFCIGSCQWPNNHHLCQRIAAELPAVVVSADYRLAPEHRLPAAIEDAAAALTWLRENLVGPAADPWLASVGDPARVFVTGESAGGCLTHHMAVRYGPRGLGPLQLAGFVEVMPAIVGPEETRSEKECPPTAFLNREVCESYCRLAMPEGATMEHWTMNPFGPDGPALEERDLGRILVVAAERDLLRDRNADYVERLAAMGKQAELVEIRGEEHAFFSLKPQSAATGDAIAAIKRFVAAAAGGGSS